MRSKFIASLCSLVVLCCAVASARAQGAAGQNSNEAATKPARRTPARRTAAKKPAATQATPQQEAGATTKKTDAAQGDAQPTAAAGAAKPTPRRRALAKKSGAAKPAGEQPSAATPQKPAASDAGATAQDQPPGSEKKTPTRTARRGVKKKEPGAAASADAEKGVDAEKRGAGGDNATAASSSASDDASKSANPRTANARNAKAAAKKSAAADDDGAKSAPPKSAAEAAKEAEYKAKLAEILKLPAWERIAELQDFLDQDLPDEIADDAGEHLVSAEAAYGDERLQAGDVQRGVALFRDAVEQAPEDMSSRLFYEVVSQLPANLVLRGQTEAAFELARKVEAKAGGSAKRLLAVAAFYVSAEQPEEAARVASQALKLSPDLPAAHQALAAALRLALKLDESAAEYARAAALDPKSVNARQSLADMKRATGKPEEALTIYRELVAADASNVAARTGVVLSLFDAGRREEAEREMDAALKADARNVQLMAGAAYWYAAHGEEKRALDLATRATEIEPRHPWAQIALARAMLASKMPFDAERALRLARLFSHFPTLDYELANALASSGLYAEAAEELARSFAVKGGAVETRLAGRIPARSESFIELLAPERRASLFEPAAADTPDAARVLKSLLSLHAALKSTDTPEARAAAEAPASAAAREFAAGADAMRAFRQLYAANRLLRRNVAPRTALELADAARKGVGDAISLPQATVAAAADELRDVRAAAIQQGATPAVPDFPRDVLDKIMRGRVEELTGWAYLNEGKAADAVAALKLAVGVLPEGSPFWRDAMWRLGTALATSGEPQQALNAYIASYDPEEPDQARLSIIHALYRKLNGTSAGLEKLVGTPAPQRPTTPTTGAPDAVATTAQPTTPTTSSPTSINPTAPPPATGEAAKSEAAKSDAAGGESVKNEPAKTDPSKSEFVKNDPTKTGESKTDEPKSADVKTGEVKSTETAPPADVKSATPEAAASPTPTPSPEAAGESKKAEETKVSPPPAPAAPPPAPPASPPVAAPPESQSPAASPRAPGASGECAMTLSAEELPLAVGSSASVVATLAGGADPAKITASTPDWSDIIVLREPASATEPGSAKFTVNSISKGTGTFTLRLKSPCGAKEVKVIVR
ncbi:MAG: hypothetical protein ABR563_19075 [Pyrinomonadaceae bacterium]